MRVTTNPDKEFVKEIRDKLKQNGGYCPCRISKTPDTKCICKEFREMIERGEGRLQTEEESDALKAPLLELLQTRNIDFTEIKGNIENYNRVADYIINLFNK